MDLIYRMFKELDGMNVDSSENFTRLYVDDFEFADGARISLNAEITKDKTAEKYEVVIDKIQTSKDGFSIASHITCDSFDSEVQVVSYLNALL